MVYIYYVNKKIVIVLGDFRTEAISGVFKNVWNVGIGKLTYGSPKRGK